MIKNTYINFVLNNVPRLLSQLDRNKNSTTFGCFDRNYWHYKIRDFPSIVLQQGTLAMALLYSNNFEGNIYYKNERIKEWAVGSLDFWVNNQLGDGSFNEYWPNEHGYPPTVFSLYSASESYKLLKNSADEIDGLFEAMLASCKFISKHKEKGATNQEIASITALYSTYQVTQEKWLLNIIEEKIKYLIDVQSEEGWFPEYGGVDIGYLSVSLNYLSEYYRLSGDKKVLNPIIKMVDFLQYFIHPNYTCGGDYGSRNTEYFLPNGLEIIAPEYPLAGSIADKIISGNSPKLPHSVDDRYLSHYILHSYVSAIQNYKNRTDLHELPCEKSCSRYFEDAGLYVYSNENYYAVLGLSKGGVLKVFSQGKEILNDCGYVIKDSSNVSVTNWIDHNYTRKRDGDCFTVSGNFHSIKQYIPTPLKHTLLRCASSMLGKSLIPILKKQLITSELTVPVKFERIVKFDKDKIIIEDCIKSDKELKEVLSSDGFSFRYVPSSKYFNTNEIDRLDIANKLTKIKQVKISKKLDCVNNDILISNEISPQ